MINGMDIDDCVDGIVASCNGDLRGALKALMLVNEQLERELARVSALATRPIRSRAAANALH
ncbi:MAG: hypothetical protein JWR73_3257 [Tardiphaga sp.]|jgi:hypothetical protein|nr:hypothetical protein [Tardiphaga sp.]MDB5573132.1 hypothetical protein [Tardiphaga sp.]MDB5627455.1 hypothetical protein [Tardiphaga sp.]MDB5629493.1 hypothetical protein [Tardiphaga sp.]